MESQVSRPSEILGNETEGKKAMSSQNLSQGKSIKRLKSPKKLVENKKTSNDMKLEDVFLNSEYFKYQSGNMSSLSFCSGDNGENRWTVDSKFEIPFRQKTPRPPSYTNDVIKSDTAVLAEKESKSWPTKMKKRHSPTKESPKEKTDDFLEGILSEKGRLDRDLISLITEQMFLAERELQITRTHLIETISKLNERDLEIIQLHEKIQNLQRSQKKEAKVDSQSKEGSDSATKSSEDYQRLIMASEKLKKQVKDMEEFLNDYGLVWVGDKDLAHKPDFDKIIKNFERLNSVAAQPKIIQTTLGAKFELPREVPIVLYSNGVLLRDNDFREYSKVSTSLFLQDIEDGYFPSELQGEYPDGVPFEVVDKRNEVYSQNGKVRIFQGQGNRLGSNFEGKPSALVYLSPVKSSRIHDAFEALDKSPLKKVNKKRSRNVFLQDDPKAFVTNQITSISQRLNIEEDFRRNTLKQVDRPLRVKIRYGKEKTESFFLDIQEAEKMVVFQTSLQRKLCEKFHDDCILDFQTNTRPTDFELHIYGQNPFRLSDCLSRYPREVGIVDNCLINVSEI